MNDTLPSDKEKALSIAHQAILAYKRAQKGGMYSPDAFKEMQAKIDEYVGLCNLDEREDAEVVYGRARMDYQEITRALLRALNVRWDEYGNMEIRCDRKPAPNGRLFRALNRAKEWSGHPS